ncbi:MAG TPA: YihY/virulence factor BrkB family protein [Gemmatimonadales bacterium]|nr:YihY/virulence factor BrkB family protein [Gemmatimonadales bacterium]
MTAHHPPRTDRSPAHRRSGTTPLTPGALWWVLKHAFIGWWADNVPRLGASLAYYTLFALAPILVIAIGVAGVAFGPEAVRGEVVGQIRGLVGEQGAVAVQSMLQGAAKPSAGVLPTAIGLITAFLGATGAFIELQTALNAIWRVQPRPGVNLGAFVRQRLISFGLVIGVGFLLLVSLLVSAALAAFNRYLGSRFPGLTVLWEASNVIVSLGVVTLLFAMVYKILPDVRLGWRDVWVGALVTAGFFSIGKQVIGLYLGTSSLASTYGAAGSVVVLLVWVYYSSQVVLLGAEFTRFYVERFRGAPPPMKHATRGPPPPELAPTGEMALDRPGGAK